MTRSKNALSNFAMNIWPTLVAAGFFSAATYLLNDSFIRSIAMAVLFVAFRFAERFIEIKQDLPQRSLFGEPAFSPHFWVRVVQALLATIFWACFMYLMIWSDNILLVLIGSAIFGMGIFLVGERKAQRNKP